MFGEVELYGDGCVRCVDVRGAWMWESFDVVGGVVSAGVNSIVMDGSSGSESVFGLCMCYVVV